MIVISNEDNREKSLSPLLAHRGEGSKRERERERERE